MVTNGAGAVDGAVDNMARADVARRPSVPRREFKRPRSRVAAQMATRAPVESDARSDDDPRSHFAPRIPTATSARTPSDNHPAVVASPSSRMKVERSGEVDAGSKPA